MLEVSDAQLYEKWRKQIRLVELPSDQDNHTMRLAAWLEGLNPEKRKADGMM